MKNRYEFIWQIQRAIGEAVGIATKQQSWAPTSQIPRWVQAREILESLKPIAWGLRDKKGDEFRSDCIKLRVGMRDAAIYMGSNALALIATYDAMTLRRIVKYSKE